MLTKPLHEKINISRIAPFWSRSENHPRQQKPPLLPMTAKRLENPLFSQSPTNRE
jgi:hypothetical protein